MTDKTGGGVTVVWVDLDRARIFHISEDRMERESVEAHRHEHHTHALENHERDCVPMYDEIAKKLGTTDRVLLLGPGQARLHLLSRLQEHFPLVARKVVGCEKSDHPTDSQIAAYALKYFHKPVG
ncbi:MAG: hypothetical protein IT285_07880 [Bdellovibrionales bacterium]|nr:hypothetical protein [Bdellovibrionales bacterium]